MIALVLVCMLTAAYGQNLQVTTNEGTIEGYPATDGNYHTFHGIPYAEPRIGIDKFKASSPSGTLPGVLHAYDAGVRCARPTPDGIVGSENCLTLDVFTNTVNTSKPVLVWLNGEESNSSMSTQYSFKRYVEEEMVVVTLNYRLSIFGFLCLRIPAAPGNAGLKDILLGLQWIQRNIAVFGGNPNNVVLVGHGSAAAMVDLITLSPKSENLVNKAITFSGSALAPWAVSYDPIGSVFALMAAMDKTTFSLDGIVELLSFNDNLNTINSAINVLNYTNNTQLFAPCIEDKTVEDAVLIDAPMNLLRAGNYSSIPYIAGYVTEEGALRAEGAMYDEWLEKMQADFTNFLPVDLQLGENQTIVTDSIRDFYFGKSPINMSSIERYLQYHGDTMVVVPLIRGVQERAVTSQSETRLLEFGYMGSMISEWNFDQIPLNGVSHGGVLNFLFDLNMKAEDENVTISLVKRISAFAHTGNPTPSGSTNWPAIISNQPTPYFYYGDNCQGSSHVEESRLNPQNDVMTFWNDLYDHYYYPLSALSSASRLMGLFSVLLWCFIVLAMF